jgi:hypothetical protein
MNEYCLLYNPRLLVSQIFPVLPLDTLINRCNQTIHQPRETHTDGQKNDLARMVRLNWMVENLKTDRIWKPIMLNLRYFLMTTITGDTRLQAIELSPHITVVPALLTIKRQYLDQFPDWINVESTSQLAELMKIPKEKIVFAENFTNWTDQELEWIEFDLQETSNHMHDEDQRLRMMYNYLDQQSDDFCFSRDWISNFIENWNQYDF